MLGSRPFSDAEIDTILPRLSIRDRALFITGFRLGFRVSELLSIRVSDVMSHGKLSSHILVSKANMKGSKQSRVVKIHPQAAEAIGELIRAHRLTSDMYLFFNSRNKTKAISRAQVHNIISSIVHVHQLDGKVSSHSWRKTFAQKVFEASGNNLAVTQKALAHQNINSTISYLQVDAEAVDNLIVNLK